MSELAWRILAILVAHSQKREWHGYLAGWTLGEMLGQDACAIQGAHVKFGGENEYEQAMHELEGDLFQRATNAYDVAVDAVNATYTSKRAIEELIARLEREP